MNPFVHRREYVASYLSMASTFAATNAALLARAREIEQRGIAALMLFIWRARSKRGQSGLLPVTTAFFAEGGEVGCRLHLMFLRP